MQTNNIADLHENMWFEMENAVEKKRERQTYFTPNKWYVFTNTTIRCAPTQWTEWYKRFKWAKRPTERTNERTKRSKSEKQVEYDTMESD